MKQDDWKFCFTISSTLDARQGLPKREKTLEFKSAFELAQFLVDGDNECLSAMQRQIDERIELDPEFKVWQKARTPLKDLPHFSQYRRRSYHDYHAAAFAKHGGKPTPKQCKLVKGLGDEIAIYPVTIPSGQIVFHGRSDFLIANPEPHPTFLSATLHPVVGFNHSKKQSKTRGACSRPLLCILKLSRNLPALWGHTRTSHEYELLFPSMLKIEETARYIGSNGDVLEASIL
jgi:hypothetical protein